jgi:hypothetical protein
MDLNCLKGRVAPRAGENDADDRPTLASGHKDNLSGKTTTDISLATFYKR